MMTEFLFVLIIIAMFAFGYFVMRILDSFLSNILKANGDRKSPIGTEKKKIVSFFLPVVV